MSPGGAALFHCNLFHASDRNLSPHNRWQACLRYNAAANRPAEIEEPRPDCQRSRNRAPLALARGDALLAAA